MQTWYALYRAWGDWDETVDDHWSPFGVDAITGRPIEFLGSAEDALRQLEDELRPAAITASTRIEREDRVLRLVRYDEQCGGDDIVEYRLVDRAHRPAADEPRPPRRARRDPTGLLPRRFLHEFEDVAGAVPIELAVTLAHLDEEVGQFVADLLFQVMDLEDEDPHEIIRHVMSVMLWMFLIGREHAHRGYPAPVPQADGEIWAQSVLVGLARSIEDGPGKYGPGEDDSDAYGSDAYGSDAYGSGDDDDPDEYGRPGTAGWRDPAVDGFGTARSPFGTEFHEVVADLIVDYRVSMLDLDEEVGRRVHEFVVQLVRLGGLDLARAVLNLLSGALWMFRLGREHAARGFPSPVPRGDGKSWIPDTLDAFFTTDD